MGAARTDADQLPDASGGAAAPSLDERFPIVAIGASAGGLDALSRFFGAMPPDQGLAFVVIVHLAPAHASHMPELLARHTAMAVTQVDASGDEPLRPDHVYVIPQNRSLQIRAGRLCLGEVERAPLIPLPIDRFFRSLAEDRQEQAICIVLSGTGSDGSLGLRDIKAEGGLVMAQSPDNAEHGGMPRSAIATGLVDVVLPVEQLPGALLDYTRHARLQAAPAAVDALAAADDAVLNDIVALLRVRGGQDFLGYKQTMLMRRVRRRMALARVEDAARYLELLRDSADEAAALGKDLLIGVTAFFRDPEAWAELAREVIAPMLHAADDDADIRIWVAGCSSGEEAYTVAILMAEQMQASARHRKVTIFATDADRQALDIGRAGSYREHIGSAVSSQRLARFFNRQGDRYVVRKELRDLVMFAPQNLLSVPPFSRLNLICCRNLLIYLEPEQQKKLIALFHFALNPGGHLMLGKAEGIGQQHGLFEPVLGKWRIFRRIGLPQRAPLEYVPLIAPGAAEARRPPRLAAGRPGGIGEAVRELLLAHCTPAAVLVDRGYRVHYVTGQTEDFLVQPSGEPTDELLAMVRDNLRPKLRALLHKAEQDGAACSASALLARGGKSPLRVEIGVLPVPQLAQQQGMLLVTFAARPAPAAAAPQDDEQVMQLLEQELQLTRRELQGAIEELVSANEELKVAHEEAMSTNEELQSANEGLETSKVELQSLNEELTTVNSQMEEKLVELETANNDLTNLLTSTHLPTLFLDKRLRIKRFTPAMIRLFSLIAGDVDRPIADIASRFPIEELLADARRVLDELAPIERAMSCGAEHYLRRTLPYSTHEGRIEGVVITFTDVSELRRATDELRQSEAKARGQAEELDALYRSGPIGLALLDRELRCLRVNDALAASLGMSAAQVVGRRITEELPWLGESLRTVRRSVIEDGEAVLNCELRQSMAGPAGIAREWLVSLYPLKDAQGAVQLVSAVVIDLTEPKRTQLRLKAAQDLTAQIERAREEDRARIAREIHDDLGAALTAITMHLQAAHAEAAARAQPLPDALAAMPRLIEGATQAVNRIIADLRPSVLDHLGVWAAIRWYAERVLPGAGIDHEVAFAGALEALDMAPERATAIFRIAQEALTNVVRHAGARRVAVRAALEGETLVLEVHDDGKGIASHPSLDTAAGGLMGMRERARGLGGELDVSAAAGGGTTVRLRLPLLPLQG